MVITVRPWREHAELIDLPTQIHACGRAAGLVPVERCVALLARVTEQRAGSSPAARSSNATSSANNATAAYPCI